MQTDRQTDTKKDRQTDRQLDRQLDREANGQIDRETVRGVHNQNRHTRAAAAYRQLGMGRTDSQSERNKQARIHVDNTSPMLLHSSAILECFRV